MLYDEDILSIIIDEVNERAATDDVFDEMFISDDFNIDFKPTDNSDSIRLYTDVVMMIYESEFYGDMGNCYCFDLPSMMCLSDKETFLPVIKKALDLYAKKEKNISVDSRIDSSHRITDEDKDKIRHSDSFTIKFTSEYPFYELLDVVK